MNRYLEAIGFRSIWRREQLEALSKEVILHYDDRRIYINEQGAIVGSFIKSFGPNLGLVVTGEFDREKNFHPSSTVPFLHSDLLSSTSYIEIEKKRAGEEYAGCLDDFHFGTAVVFQVINSGEYMCSRQKTKNGRKKPDLYPGNVCLSALSISGRVILPVLKNEFEADEIRERTEKHARLSEQARKGDEDAFDELADYEYEVMNEVQKRIQNEDLFTIVDTSLFPSGMEADQYRLVGTILDCQIVENSRTGEKVWQMTIKVCGVPIRLAIHEDQLLGEPKPGRRFRGSIWLSGEIGLVEDKMLKD